MLQLSGSGIGGGIAIGRARVLEVASRDVPRRRIEPADIEAEQLRLSQAIGQVKAELAGLVEGLPQGAPTEAAALLEVHAMILDDPALSGAARASIVEHLWNAEWAMSAQAGHLAAQFEALDDAYLRERGRDVQQVADRVMRALAGLGGPLADGSEPVIFVAEDIAPADMLTMRCALGFAIDLGGTTSHSAILARSMNVPAVLGLGAARMQVQDDDWVILDGDAGVVIVAPDDAVLADYQARQAAGERERAKLRALTGVAAVTRDGQAISLQINIERPDEARDAAESGAGGVGLFRSEFLFMNRAELPCEDEQFEAYRQVVQALKGRPVTIRTIDIGADKTLNSGVAPAASTANPALGRRAIRYSLAHPDVFLAQLRAILRASACGPVRLLVPMIAHHHEVDSLMTLLARAREDLRAARCAFDPALPVGAMIEVPAAALCAGYFARRLDFLSIGTNDLIQYTLAIDRVDHEVASLYDPFHPAVLRLVAGTIRAAREAGRPVSVCGEMAGDWRATALLLGMGLTEFSMHPASLLRVKREILQADTRWLSPRVSRIVRGNDPVRVAAALARLAQGGPQAPG
ncbi:MAG: phosphoenolpyruvate--protein phosphotransferase [Betaproteobacteria bacterium]|nr:phosphoenolpyruvate--protein phosphotransferase [Betaproteobacteria bacterium]